MLIQSAKIKNKTDSNQPDCIIAIVNGIQMSIPFDPANTDYQAFLKYQADGGKVYGADEEVPDGQAS